MQFSNNLSLSLQFDQQKKFLLCGELLNFQVKLTSPDFGVETCCTPEFFHFLDQIGAAVESIDISTHSVASYSSSASLSASSLDSLRGKKMKSVESLSNLLKDTTLTSPSSFSHSKDSQTSQSSMSSVTARRFNSLGANRTKLSKPFWNAEEEAVYIPLEAFIDPEALGSTSCHKAIAKFRISVNELVPVDLGFDFLGFDLGETAPSSASDLINGHRLVKIGQIETSFTVLRPIEVSLRTHRLPSNQIILQLNVHFDHRDPGEFDDLVGFIEIDSVDIVLSDSFTSKCCDVSTLDFIITPLSSDQVPFVFDACPQTFSLIYSWTILNEEVLRRDDFRLTAELRGKLNGPDQQEGTPLSLSFESSLPIETLFPKTLEQSIHPQITKIKLLDSDCRENSLKVYEPFEIEVFLHNPTSDSMPISIEVIQRYAARSSSKVSPTSSINPIEAWFQMENLRKTPGILLLNPLVFPLDLGLISPYGFKSVRLQLIPVRRGIMSLFDEFRFILNGKNGRKGQENSIIKIE